MKIINVGADIDSQNKIRNDVKIQQKHTSDLPAKPESGVMEGGEQNGAKENSELLRTIAKTPASCPKKAKKNQKAKKV